MAESAPPPPSPAIPAASGPGRFIVFEGIDGAGTTTQLQRLIAAMNQSGVPAHGTAQPSRGPIGRLLRAFLGGEGAPVDPRAMALLFAADRRDHLSREVEGRLDAGIHVACDRYVLSSLVYQTAAGAPRDLVIQANASARTPDLTLLIDVPVSVAAARRARRTASAGVPVEIYDDDATQQAVAEAYRAAAAAPPAGLPVGPVVTIDGAADPAEVAAAVLRALASCLGLSLAAR